MAPIYALAYSQEGKTIQHVYYQKVDDRKAFIEKLSKDHYVNQREISKKVDEFIKQEDLSTRCKLAGNYFTCSADVDGKQIYLLIHKTDKEGFDYSYWKSQQDLNNATLKGAFSGDLYKNKNILDQEATASEHTPNFVKKNLKTADYDTLCNKCVGLTAQEYKEEKVQSTDGKHTFFVLLRSTGPQFFKTEMARQFFCKANYETTDTGRLNREDVTKRISPEHYNLVIAEAIKLGEGKDNDYISHQIPTTDKKVDIFSLAYKEGENGKVLFFDMQEKCDAFIAEKLVGYTNIGKIHDGFYGAPEGMKGMTGALKKMHLDALLLQERDSFSFNLQLTKDKILYCWATRQANGHLRYAYSNEERQRKEAFLKENLRDLRDEIIKIEHTVLDRVLKKRIEKTIAQNNAPLGAIKNVCVNDKDAWIDEAVEVNGQKLTILYFNSGNIIRTRIFKSLKEATDYCHQEKLTDVKQAYQTADKYPHAMGVEMLHQQWKPEECARIQENLQPNEFWGFDMEAMPSCYPIIVKDANGKVAIHVFKTQDAYDLYVNTSGYKNGYARHSEFETYVMQRAAACSPVEKKSAYFVKSLPGDICHFITASYDKDKNEWKAASEYIAKADVLKKCGQCQAQGIELIDEKKKLTKAEVDFVKQETTPKSDFKADEYIVTTCCQDNYTAVYAKMEGELKFRGFPTQSTELTQCLEALKDRKRVS